MTLCRSVKRQPQRKRGEKMKHKTLSQVLAEYKERGNKAYYRAMIAVRDEAEAYTVEHCRELLHKPKPSLKEVRYAVDILECLVERGEENK